jgi:hypothetical protein
VEHPLELTERRIVGRVCGEDVAVDLDGALAIAELLLERLAEAELQLGDLRVALRELDLP